MPAIGFDNRKYLTTQSEQIKKRIAQFGGKLYLEFGGKLFDDYHASRVLPGFEPDSKIRMLQQLQDDVEILIAINAADIEKNARALLSGVFARLDLVTREEFDIQAQVLQRTREKLKALEERLDQLEQGNGR